MNSVDYGQFWNQAIVECLFKRDGFADVEGRGGVSPTLV